MRKNTSIAWEVIHWKEKKHDHAMHVMTTADSACKFLWLYAPQGVELVLEQTGPITRERLVTMKVKPGTLCNLYFLSNTAFILDTNFTMIFNPPASVMSTETIIVCCTITGMPITIIAIIIIHEWPVLIVTKPSKSTTVSGKLFFLPVCCLWTSGAYEISSTVTHTQCTCIHFLTKHIDCILCGRETGRDTERQRETEREVEKDRHMGRDRDGEQVRERVGGGEADTAGIGFPPPNKQHLMLISQPASYVRGELYVHPQEQL